MSEMVPIHLLLAFAQTCALQPCPHALAPRAGTCASALHIQLEYIIGEGQRDPNGKQFAVPFLPPMISGAVDRHHGPLSCCPDGAGRISEVERSLMMRWVVGSIRHGVDPLSYFSFQPVLHDWCNKGRGMCYPVCGMVHMWRQRVSFLTIRMVLNHMSDAI